MKRNYCDVVVQNGQYEENCCVVKVSYTTRRGLIRRLKQLREKHAVYGDNWAGWINASVVIASDNDEFHPCTIIGGEYCCPVNDWLDFSDEDQLNMQLTDAGIEK